MTSTRTQRIAFIAVLAPWAGISCAPPPAAPPTTAPVVQSALVRTVTGRVDNYSYTAAHELDGVTLDNGARIHFPAHAGAALFPLVAKGELIAVTGSEGSTPAGNVLEATKITNTGTGKTVDIAAMTAPPH